MIMIRRILFTNLDYQNAANKPSSWDPKNRQLYSICVKFYRFKFPHVWFLLRNHIKICVSSLIDLFSIYQAKETVEIRNSNLKNNASIWNWTLKKCMYWPCYTVQQFKLDAWPFPSCVDYMKWRRLLPMNLFQLPLL